MFQKLVSHNDDIKRLVDKGYAVGYDNAYLIVRDIPYLDQEQRLQIGAFVSKLVRSADEAQISEGKNRIPLSDNPDNVYKTNIQIGELNALNACLAVIKYKQLRGFYMDSMDDNYEVLFNISDMTMAGSDSTDNQNDED